jgi:hypothetical protein
MTFLCSLLKSAGIQKAYNAREAAQISLFKLRGKPSWLTNIAPLLGLQVAPQFLSITSASAGAIETHSILGDSERRSFFVLFNSVRDRKRIRVHPFERPDRRIAACQRFLFQQLVLRKAS